MSNSTVTQGNRLEWIVLLTLKVRGFATVDQVAESTGVDPSALKPVLEQIEERGEAKYREGRVTGYMLTGQGRARITELRPDMVSSEEAEVLGNAYEAFLEPNAAFKQLTTDWQLKSEDSATDDLVSRLAAIHAQATVVVAIASARIERFGTYQHRFDRALERFSSGDEDALAKPMKGSYHDVWMEFHEDLLASLGRERTEEDG